MMETLEWLRRLADPAQRRGRTAFLCSIGERVYATDGAALVSVDASAAAGAESLGDGPSPEGAERMRDWLSVPDCGGGFVTTSRALRRWCQGPTWSSPGPCTDCDGTGVRECEDCGGSGECHHCRSGECPECDGARTQRCACKGGLILTHPKARPGSFAGRTVDRVLLGRVACGFPDGGISIYPRGAEEPILMVGPGSVRACIMPMRHAEPETTMHLSRHASRGAPG